MYQEREMKSESKKMVVTDSGCMGICCLAGGGNSTGNGGKTSANADTAVQGRESSDA